MRVLPLALCALAASATSQTTIYTVTGTTGGDRFGAAVASGRDANGDGYGDWLVGAPQPVVGGVPKGYARAYSGADGSQHVHVVGGALGDEFGSAIAFVGDLDLDGRSDFVVGAPKATSPALTGGEAKVFSGATGVLLHTYTGSAALGQTGRAVAGPGDVDGDGVPDVAVGDPEAPSTAGAGAGLVTVHSGATSAPLLTIGGVSAGAHLGTSLDAAGDTDADGFPDLLIGIPDDDGAGLDAGVAWIVSGSTGAILVTHAGQAAGDQLGFAVGGGGDVNADGVAASTRDYSASFSGSSGALIHVHKGATGSEFPGRTVDIAGDWDGDGMADVLVGGPKLGGLSTPGFPAAIKSGRATLYSGKDNSTLFVESGKVPFGELGAAVAGGADIDGDGAPELVLAEPGAAMAGRVKVIGGPAPPTSFAGVPGQLSLATGGVQSLSLVAGPDFAGLPYLVLGSVSGTDPGFPLDGLTLPLNVDAYTLHTLLAPNAPPLSGSFALLDASGNASASLTVPTGLPPTLAGTTIHHAYAVIELLPTLLHVVFTSDPAPLDLVP